MLALAAEGIEFVEISGGTYEAPAMMMPKKSTRQREAYFLSFCEAVRERLDAPPLGLREAELSLGVADAGLGTGDGIG